MHWLMHIVYTVLCTQHFREFRNEFSVSLIYENIKIIKIWQINLFIISQSGIRSKVFCLFIIACTQDNIRLVRLAFNFTASKLNFLGRIDFYVNKLFNKFKIRFFFDLNHIYIGPYFLKTFFLSFPSPFKYFLKKQWLPQLSHLSEFPTSLLS